LQQKNCPKILFYQISQKIHNFKLLILILQFWNSQNICFVIFERFSWNSILAFQQKFSKIQFYIFQNSEILIFYVFQIPKLSHCWNFQGRPFSNSFRNHFESKGQLSDNDLSRLINGVLNAQPVGQYCHNHVVVKSNLVILATIAVSFISLVAVVIIIM